MFTATAITAILSEILGLGAKKVIENAVDKVYHHVVGTKTNQEMLDLILKEIREQGRAVSTEDIKLINQRLFSIEAKIDHLIAHIPNVPPSGTTRVQSNQPCEVRRLDNADGSTYTGWILNGKEHGQGTSYTKDYVKIYEGEWICGKWHGQGISFYNDGKKNYEGEWLNGKYHGKGVAYHSNGQKNYEGEWKDGKYHGKGVAYHSNGQKNYEGEWLNGLFCKGVEYHSNGQKCYESGWLDGKYHGKGVEYHPNGKKNYEGEWKDGKRHGKGVAYDSDGKKNYEGEWLNGMRHGKGVEYDWDYKKIRKGRWNHGYPVEVIVEEKKGCFISSACVRVRGLSDDCDELQTLREFRDAFLLPDQDRATLVRSYYKIAPLIVEMIENRDDKLEIYDTIWQELVLPVVSLIKQTRYFEATFLYEKFVEDLQKELAS